jgi:hypothetical protein
VLQSSLQNLGIKHGEVDVKFVTEKMITELPQTLIPKTHSHIKTHFPEGASHRVQGLGIRHFILRVVG